MAHPGYHGSGRRETATAPPRIEEHSGLDGKVTLDAAVSSNDDMQRVRLLQDDKENSPLDSESLFWIEIRGQGFGWNP
jgi:hypothetical protein